MLDQISGITVDQRQGCTVDRHSIRFVVSSLLGDRLTIPQPNLGSTDQRTYGLLPEQVIHVGVSIQYTPQSITSKNGARERLDMSIDGKEIPSVAAGNKLSIDIDMLSSLRKALAETSHFSLSSGSHNILTLVKGSGPPLQRTLC
ncbi:hypothetical protein F2Q68_00031012 [Brassica cretica]|uniref:Uncharacterized protein n=1 Tax=Brassica cretica TaxID=69181 RepID=A0A8S9GAZ3_BRACR|nr:hypothetical protein F2Q68_00031012 [Brassica cretica]